MINGLFSIHQDLTTQPDDSWTKEQSWRQSYRERLVEHVGLSLYSVSQKKIPLYGFLKFFPKRLGIFNQFFTHLLCDHYYTRLQIFIRLPPTLTKLCHTKRDHLANFYISLEL